MATVIDSLIVELGLDPTKFDKGQKEALEAFKKTQSGAAKAAKDMEAKGKQAAQFFAEIKNQAVGLFAVMAGGLGLKQFVETQTRASAATGRTSRQLGIQTEALSAWQGAAERAGVTAEETTAGIQSLVTQFEAARISGDIGKVPFLQRLGVQLADLKDPNSALIKISAGLQRETPTDAQYIGQGLGLSKDFTSFLQQGPEKIRALLREQKQLGVVTQADATAATARNKAWLDFQQILSSTARTMLTEATPAIDKFLEAMTNFAKENPEFIRAVDVALVALTTMGTIVAGLNIATKLISITGSVTGLTAALRALGAVFSDAGVVAAMKILGVGAIAGGVVSQGDIGTLDQIHAQRAKEKGWIRNAWNWLTGNQDQNGATVPIPGASQAAPGTGLPSAARQRQVYDGLLDLIEALEGSGDNAVSPKKAYGRYQITPETAKTYGLDYSKLNDPVYGRMAASTILADLSKRYNGDIDAIVTAYHGGPGTADRWLASGRNDAALGPHTRAYLSHERSLVSRGAVAPGGGGTTVQIDNITVNSNAKDAPGIARDIGAELRGALGRDSLILSTQANSGLR